MKLTLKDIANRTNGTLYGEDRTVTSLVTDSRKVQNNTLFAAIKGERVDGFDFIESLDKNHSVAYITDRHPKNAKNPYILTDDVIRTIGDAAALHLESVAAKHIAVTGSVGKTTTKNFIASALLSCMDVHFAKGNFNNELGLPLTALDVTEHHDAVILEMGMRGLGQIKYLCNIAKPDVAVITNIGVCHIELLGSKQNILKAKLEIIDALSDDGVAVLNGDDGMLKTIKPGKKTLWYGIDNDNCDIRAVNVVNNKFDLVYKDKSYPVKLATLGIHNVYNALAAVSVGIALGCDIQKLIIGVESFAGDGSRQNIYDFNGIKIFDDGYNASPDSMKAAMNVIKGFENRTVLVLGDMLELGDIAVSAHKSLAKSVYDCKAQLVICIGPLMKNLYDELENVQKYHVQNNDEALEILKNTVVKGDILLFKGSNSMQLPYLLEKFKGEWEK